VERLRRWDCVLLAAERLGPDAGPDGAHCPHAGHTAHRLHRRRNQGTNKTDNGGGAPLNNAYQGQAPAGGQHAAASDYAAASGYAPASGYAQQDSAPAPGYAPTPIYAPALGYAQQESARDAGEQTYYDSSSVQVGLQDACGGGVGCSRKAGWGAGGRQAEAQL
jgi:hypothetical protein